MDGDQVARQLRGDRDLGDALIIAVTGDGQDDDHHLVKPLGLAELTTLMQRRRPELESTRP
ncbi:MAG TPA: hypothetical protein VG406_17375 [Isosphaeraceae bacterium]|nr:hypothetical protein [Isosphaeraceae bacterium]